MSSLSFLSAGLHVRQGTKDVHGNVGFMKFLQLPFLLLRYCCLPAAGGRCH